MAVPDIALIRKLPALRETTVTEDFIDVNGHMNILKYLLVNSLAADVVCQQVGIDDDYRARRRMGVFTTEHHLKYFSEMRLGTTMTSHPQVLGRSDKAVHMIVHLLDATHDRLSNTTELVLVHVDLDTRRAVPMPPDVADGFDRLIADHAALGIEAPLCGAIGIRPR
jgi:acyl-CoA thioester hydrolase